MKIVEVPVIGNTKKIADRNGITVNVRVFTIIAYRQD